MRNKVLIFLLFAVLMLFTSCEPIGGYKFTFDSAGGNDVHSMLVEIGGYYTLPVPTKDGGVFIGWLCNGKIYTVVEAATSSMHFVARWLDWNLVDYDKLLGTKQYKYYAINGDDETGVFVTRNNDLFKVEYPEDEGEYLIIEFTESGVKYFDVEEYDGEIDVELRRFEGANIITSLLILALPYFELFDSTRFIIDGEYSYVEMDYSAFITSFSIYDTEDLLGSGQGFPVLENYLPELDMTIRVEFHPNWATLLDFSVVIYFDGILYAGLATIEFGAFPIEIPEVE